jgi:hypothetical protein
MSTTRQRRDGLGDLRDLGDPEAVGRSWRSGWASFADTETDMFSPPCAGMIQIRFDGRSVDRFLSARITGLPCVCRRA